MMRSSIVPIKLTPALSGVYECWGLLLHNSVNFRRMKTSVYRCPLFGTQLLRTVRPGRSLFALSLMLVPLILVLLTLCLNWPISA